MRKAVQDGYPVENILVSDLHAGKAIESARCQRTCRCFASHIEFWKLGHEMFRSTPGSFPVPIITGDVFDTSFLSPLPPFTVASPPTNVTPDIHSAELDKTTLNPFHGHISAIYCGYLFHLFDEEKQTHIARCLASLLSLESGSMIFGVHGGRHEKGYWHPTGSQRWMFCHSPDSWQSLWESIFGEGKVRVEAAVRKDSNAGDDVYGTYPGNKDPWHVLEWCATRL